MTDDDLRMRLEPLLDTLVEQLGPIIRDAARAQLEGLLGQLGGAPAPMVQPRAPREAKPAPAANPTKPAHKSPVPVCRKCGRVGGNARGCGTAHQPLAKKPAADDSDDEDEGARATPTPEQGGGDEPPLFAELVQAGHAARAQRVATGLDPGAGPARGAERADVAPRRVEPVADATAATPRAGYSLDELHSMMIAGRAEHRRSIRHLPTYGTRPRTITSGQTGSGRLRLSDDEKAFAWTDADRAALAERPRTRGECIGGERPCPWMGCRYHLGLDVSPDIGSVKLTFPDRELEQLPETCALDVAERGGDAVHAGFEGGCTLEEISLVMNLTRERIRQIETVANENLQLALRRAGIKSDAIAANDRPDWMQA